eukprot:147101-Pleurochrysis_carterae.AAC.1
MRWCGGATSAMAHARTGAKKPEAERERSANAQSMRMQKWEIVHASDEKKGVRRRLQESYAA